jgi:hypothetical protein
MPCRRYAVSEDVESEPPHYIVYLEPPPGVAVPTAAAADLDGSLRDESAVYAAWRRKRAIGPCEVRAVEPGGFEALRAARLREGASPQQLKVSRVLRAADHAAILEEHRSSKRTAAKS